MRNQTPSVMISAQNANEMVYRCCASIVMVNDTGSCTLDVFKTISCSNVKVLCFWSMHSGDRRIRRKLRSQNVCNGILLVVLVFQNVTYVICGHSMQNGWK